MILEQPRDNQTHDRNVLGAELEPCTVGDGPTTGFFRDGHCRTCEEDIGSHTVCVVVTQRFLSYTRARGNDLETPQPHFPGLKPGDRWCVCASRWLEAYEANAAPAVVLASTHERALDVIPLELLESCAS